LTTDVTERRDPKTLPEDIYHVLADDTDHEVSEENVEWAGEVFKDLLRTRMKKREAKKGEEVLRFSALGKKDRQIWYQANKPETAEKMPGKQNFKFLYGDVLEVLLLFLAREAGHTVENTQRGVEEDGVKGSIDADIDGILVDVKSASSYSFEKFKSGAYLFDDPFGYVSQLAGYANALGRDRAGFLVADKVHGDITFVEFDKLYIDANPPGPRIKHLREVISQDTPPARCYPDIPEGKSGNRKLSVGCSYCPFKNDCWSDANSGKGLRKFWYSRGPVWLSEVKKEPLVEEDKSGKAP
jgi:hypothetical protein